jgi:hypothetical protein
VEYLILNDYYTDAVYKGTVSIGSGKPFGNGEIYGEDGTVYRGEMSGGERNGYGVFEWKGNTYEGFWVNGEATGSGRLKYKSGTIKTGNFIRMILNGNGKIIWPEGGKLEGTFKNGNIIKGNYINEKGEKKLYGFLGGDGGNGFTTLDYYNGDRLVSVFENGLLKRGSLKRYSYLTKSKKKLLKKIEKEFRKSDPYWWQSSYRWDFEHLYIYFPSFIRRDLDVTVPDFSYDTDEIMRIGTYTFVDGSVYKGYLRQNIDTSFPQFSSYGELIYGPESDKKSYYGMWWDDKKNGYGVLTYKDGKIEKGIFLNNMFYKQQEFDAELMKLFHQFD